MFGSVQATELEMLFKCLFVSMTLSYYHILKKKSSNFLHFVYFFIIFWWVWAKGVREARSARPRARCPDKKNEVAIRDLIFLPRHRFALQSFRPPICQNFYPILCSSYKHLHSLVKDNQHNHHLRASQRPCQETLCYF